MFRIRKFSGSFLIVCLLLCTLASADDYRFIRYGDTDQVVRLLQAYLGVSGKECQELAFGDETLAALEEFQQAHNLPASGVFDSETLILLLGLDPDDSEIFEMVWVPMYMGEHYHTHEECSSMDDPRQMPLCCAKELGFKPCGNCYLEE